MRCGGVDIERARNFRRQYRSDACRVTAEDIGVVEQSGGMDDAFQWPKRASDCLRQVSVRRSRLATSQGM